MGGGSVGLAYLVRYAGVKVVSSAYPFAVVAPFLVFLT